MIYLDTPFRTHKIQCDIALNLTVIKCMQIKYFTACLHIVRENLNKI